MLPAVPLHAPRPTNRFTYAALTALSLLATGSATGEQVLYHDNLVPTVYSDDVWRSHEPIDFSIWYDTGSRHLIFHAVLDEGMFGFALSLAQADSLAGIVEKYKAWNIRASRMKVELEKEIAPLPVAGTYWDVGSKRLRGAVTELPVYFFSQTEVKHQLVLTFPPFVSKDGRSFQPPSVYFDWTNALELRRALSDQAMKAFLAKPLTREQIAGEFE